MALYDLVVAEMRGRHAETMLPLHGFLRQHGLEGLNGTRYRLLVPGSERPSYGLVHHPGKSDSSPLIIDARNGEPLVTAAIFKQHHQFFEPFHDPPPRRRKATRKDGNEALEGILHELIGRQLLRRVAGTGAELYDGYAGKDLTLALSDGYELKRAASGAIYIVTRSDAPDAKYGHSPVAEVDGLARSPSGGVFVLEAKKRKVDVAPSHLETTVFPRIKQFFPGEQVSYVLVSHHYTPVHIGDRHRHDIYRFIASKKERQVCVAAIGAGVEPIILDFGEKRAAIRELVAHVIAQYQRGKHLQHAYEAFATITKSAITLHDRQQGRIAKLRKVGQGLWREE